MKLPKITRMHDLGKERVQLPGCLPISCNCQKSYEPVRQETELQQHWTLMMMMMMVMMIVMMTMMMVCSTAVLHPMGSCCCRMPTSYWSNQPNSPFSWSCMQFHGAAVSARFARICLGLRRSHRSQRTCKSNHVEESVKKIGALRRRSVVHWVHCTPHPQKITFPQFTE